MRRERIAVAATIGAVVVAALGIVFIVVARHVSGLGVRRQATAGLDRRAGAESSLAATPVLPAPAVSTASDFVGVLLPALTVNVAPRISGRIAQVNADLGTVLREGEPLASLDTQLEQHDLAIAQASFRAAQATSSAARVEVARSRDQSSRRKDTTVVVANEKLSLVSGEEIARAAFDEHSATAKLLASAAAAVQEQRHVEQVSTLLDEHVLRAPFDCVVAARYLDPGAFVRAGDPVVRIVALGDMMTRFAVPEDQTPSVKIGATLQVTLESTTLRGHVVRISPEVEPASRMVFVEGKLEGAAGACGPGCAGLAGRIVRVALVSP